MRAVFHCCPGPFASIVQNRRGVSAGTRGPNCGTARSRYVRMNAVRHARLAASVDDTAQHREQLRDAMDLVEDH